MSLCPKATETDSEIAKVKVRWKLCSLKMTWSFWSSNCFLPFCYRLSITLGSKWKGELGVVQTGQSWEGTSSGSIVVSYVMLCSPNGLNFLQSPKPISKVGVKFIWNSGGYLLSPTVGKSEVFSIAQVWNIWVKKIKSQFWGLGSFSQPSFCRLWLCHGVSTEVWDCWMCGHWSQHWGRKRAVGTLHIRAQCLQMGYEWRAGCLSLAGGSLVLWKAGAQTPITGIAGPWSQSWGRPHSSSAWCK